LSEIKCDSAAHLWCEEIGVEFMENHKKEYNKKFKAQNGGKCTEEVTSVNCKASILDDEDEESLDDRKIEKSGQ
jgi:hypothetical protein